MSKIGLVLEGGGMRGMYTVGVLDAFDEQNFMPDYVVGVSAGACNAISYVAGQKGRAYRVVMDNVGDKRYVSLDNLIKTKSMFGMEYIFNEIPNTIDLLDYETFMESKTEFVTGVTNVKTGKAVFFSKKHLNHDSTVLRASSSIPIFSPMVEFCGGKYLDGGTSDPIPVDKAIQDGCDKVIVVLTQHREFIKSPEKFRHIYKHYFKDYPEMITTLDKRHEVYNSSKKRVFELEAEGKAIVIAPSQPLRLGRFEHDRAKLQAIYELGKANEAAIAATIKSLWQPNL